MIIGTIKTVSSRALFEKNDADSNDSDTDTDVSDAEDEDQSNPGIGWAYVGSHNFTPSAWGTLSGSSFHPVLNVCPDITLAAFGTSQSVCAIGRQLRVGCRVPTAG